MENLPISAFIITKNEERCIGDAIDSISNIASEIIIVDSGSEDSTCEIAQQKGAKVISNEWLGYGPQKRFAEEQCKYDWLLNLDADEVMSPNLQDEIVELFFNTYPSLSMYRIKVKTVYAFHRKPRLLAEYNNVIRLYNRTINRFPDHPTWDAIIPNSEDQVGQLNGDCLHHSSPGIGHYAEKFNRYTTLQAAEQKLKPYWILVVRLLFGFPLDFIKAYMLKRHITGGIYGFILSVSYAYSRFLKNAKMMEKHLNQGVKKN